MKITELFKKWFGTEKKAENELTQTGISENCR